MRVRSRVHARSVGVETFRWWRVAAITATSRWRSRAIERHQRTGRRARRHRRGGDKPSGAVEARRAARRAPARERAVRRRRSRAGGSGGAEMGGSAGLGTGGGAGSSEGRRRCGEPDGDAADAGPTDGAASDVRRTSR